MASTSCCPCTAQVAAWEPRYRPWASWENWLFVSWCRLAHCSGNSRTQIFQSWSQNHHLPKHYPQPGHFQTRTSVYYSGESSTLFAPLRKYRKRYVKVALVWTPWMIVTWVWTPTVKSHSRLFAAPWQALCTRVLYLRQTGSWNRLSWGQVNPKSAPNKTTFDPWATVQPCNSPCRTWSRTASWALPFAWAASSLQVCTNDLSPVRSPSTILIILQPFPFTYF